MSPIIAHPDVKRMLLDMRAKTWPRRLCLPQPWRSMPPERAEDAPARLAAQERASLLTPLAKALSTDFAVEWPRPASRSMAAWLCGRGRRGAVLSRCAHPAIYEGTNGIQAIDLVARKIGLSGGTTVRNEITPLPGCGPQHQLHRGRMVEAAAKALDSAITCARTRDCRAFASKRSRLAGRACGPQSPICASSAVSARQPASARSRRCTRDGEALRDARFFAATEALRAPAAGFDDALAGGGERQRRRIQPVMIRVEREGDCLVLRIDRPPEKAQRADARHVCRADGRIACAERDETIAGV